MRKEEIKNKKSASTTEARKTSISYRLKCAKTANGLSHFSMYGDVPKEKTLL